MFFRKDPPQTEGRRDAHPLIKTAPARCTWVHLGAVVADAPSPLSTPRSAAGQAQLRLGHNATGQAPTLSGAQEE